MAAEGAGEAAAAAPAASTAEGGEAAAAGAGERGGRGRGRGRGRGGRDRDREGARDANGENGEASAEPRETLASEGAPATEPGDQAVEAPQRRQPLTAPAPAMAAESFVAAAPAPVPQPAAPAAEPIRITPYVLPTSDLGALAVSAGLEWHRSQTPQ